MVGTAVNPSPQNPTGPQSQAAAGRSLPLVRVKPNPLRPSSAPIAPRNKDHRELLRNRWGQPRIPAKLSQVWYAASALVMIGGENNPPTYIDQPGGEREGKRDKT